MRPRDIITAILFTVLLVWIFLLITENKVESDLKQTEIDHLKKTNEAQRDSLEKILKLKSDSLKIAFETIKQATAEREERHRITQRTIENLKRIVYIQYNDSSRTAELSKLYPSFKP